MQTTSVKNAENGLLWERWSAFWAKQCRTWCLVCTQTSEHTRQPLHRQVNPVMHTSTPRHAPELGYPRAGHRASLRMRAPSCRSSGQPAERRARGQPQRQPPTEAISHAIPPSTFHTLKYLRCNSNVFGHRRELAQGNCMRLSGDAAPDICHGTTCIKGHFRPH